MLRRNVLIFHQAALGDFVVTWPLAVACGRMFPQSRIIYVTAAGKGKLAEHVLGVESVDIESGFSSLWSDASAVAPGAIRMIESAHAVLSFVADDSGAWSGNVRQLAPEAAVAHLTTKPPTEWTQHVARYIAHQLTGSFAVVAAATAQMIDSLSRRGFGRRPGKPAGVAIHPGSGAARKNWPKERFIDLARVLHSSGRDVRIIVGEVEVEQFGADGIAAFAEVARIVQPASLVELAQVLAESEAVVANDSGPAHLAGIMGVPTVSLFGPTSDSARWRPLGPQVTVIDAPALDAITVDQVRAAVMGRSTPSAGSEATESRSPVV